MPELKQIVGKSLFFDNTDDGFYDKHLIKLENGEEIIFSPIGISKLKELEKNQNNILLNFILDSCPSIYRFAPTPDFFGYKNEDDLTVCYHETDNYLLVVSLGESQPGRYKIYIEGVFKKNS